MAINNSKTFARFWTETSIDCYRRGCRCEGCYLKDTLETPCMMKFAVIDLVTKFGAPKEEENELTGNQQKIVDAILNGANTFEDIAKTAEINIGSVKSALTKMYPMAEYDGVIYKNKRFKFPQFINWVRGNNDNV